MKRRISSVFLIFLLLILSSCVNINAGNGNQVIGDDNDIGSGSLASMGNSQNESSESESSDSSIGSEGASVSSISSLMSESSDDKKTQTEVTLAASSVTVSFNATGGTCSKDSIKVTVSHEYGEFPTPTRDYYTFTGWFTSESGDTKVTPSSIVPDSGSHTLYAHWTQNSPSNWIPKKDMPLDAQVIEQKWIYTVGEWMKSGSGSKEYASFPDGFDKNHSLYNMYSDSPYEIISKPSNPTNGTTYRDVTNSHSSWVYWHWCYSINENGDLVLGGPYNAFIADCAGWDSRLKRNISIR